MTHAHAAQPQVRNCMFVRQFSKFTFLCICVIFSPMTSRDLRKQLVIPTQLSEHINSTAGAENKNSNQLSFRSSQSPTFFYKIRLILCWNKVLLPKMTAIKPEMKSSGKLADRQVKLMTYTAIAQMLIASATFATTLIAFMIFGKLV